MLFGKFYWIKTQTNETSVDKDSEFYNRSMKSLFQNNDIEMYSAHNEGKSAIAERLIRTFKTKFVNISLQYQKLVYW